MSSIWATGGYTHTAERMARLGPYLDGFVGTDGEHQTLNAAIAAGWTNMRLATGATMNADIHITADHTHIIGPWMHWMIINASTHKIYIEADYCILAGFKLYNGTGTGLIVEGGYNLIDRVGLSSWSTTGLTLNNGIGNRVENCEIISNTSHGVLIAAGSDYNMIGPGNIIINNGGYGIVDTNGTSTEGLNRLENNSSGARSGMSYIDGASID